MSQRIVQRKAAGVTLVELLVVIAIIGLLIGLLIPAVNIAYISVKKGTIKAEVDTLVNAIEQYKNKYGDYPPDGSSWPIMEAHLRKAFPDILQSEMNFLNPHEYNNPSNAFKQVGSVADIRNDNDISLQSLITADDDPNTRFINVMDRAEALPFFLGGFSQDKQRPFSGTGGPFIATGVAAQPFQYNGSRENPLFPFKATRLSLDQISGYTISTDEVRYGEIPCQPLGGSAPRNDLLPVYLSETNTWEEGAPYVYFDSRTYIFAKGSLIYNNFYQRSSISAPTVYGAARPYLSDVADTSVGSTTVQRWANQSTYQILSPGLDGRYGGRTAADMLGIGPVLFTVPTGQQCIPSAIIAGRWSINGVSSKAYVLPEHAALGIRPGQDNTTNAVEGRTLEDALAAGESK